MAKERHKIVPASYLVLIEDDKILMLRRFNTGYEDGNYSIVAGHVDEGETFIHCIIREAKEEAGIILKSEDLKVCHVMHRNGGKGNERIDIFISAKDWSGEIEIKEKDKCDDLSWFSFDNIPENTIPCIKQAINCIKNKIFYSEFGWD